MSVTIGVRSLTTFGAGIAAALIAFCVFQAMTADAVGSDESTFVPVTPCRLIDTRPDSQVGPRSAPLGPNDQYSVQVTGAAGECNVPATATAVAINLTGVTPSQDTFLSVYPDDAVNPGTSVVNMVAGQAAVPNKIDVKLGPSGKLVVFNRFGNIHVVGDVMGYYRHDGLADLQARISELEADAGTDQSVLDRLAAVEAENAQVDSMLADVVGDLAAHDHDDVYYTNAQVDSMLAAATDDAWAYVISNGGIHASSGNLTVTHPATGEYCVVVSKRASHKAAQVTLADPDGYKIVSVGTGHGSACNPLFDPTHDVVPVYVVTTADAPVDANFTIVVPAP